MRGTARADGVGVRVARETTMQQRVGPMTVIRDRFQWGAYGFVAGIVLGLILGWVFNRVVGTILWVGLAVLLVVLFFSIWRWVTDRGRRAEEIVSERVRSVRGDGDEAIETSSYVIETRVPQAEREER